MESRTQDSRPRPRTQKKSEARPRTAFPRTDTLEAMDRNARGQGKNQGHKRKCSPKKKVFTKIFQAISTKQRFPKIFQALHNVLTIQKIVLSSSRGQANFRDLRPRGQSQGQGLDLRGQAKDFKMCPRGLHLCQLRRIFAQTTRNTSSVARGRWGGGYRPPIDMSTKMQNGKNTTFLALWRLFYALEWTK